MKLLVLLLSIVATAWADTRILDMSLMANGRPVSGYAKISWPEFFTAGEEHIAGGEMTVWIVSGRIDVTLKPTAGGSPSCAYQVEWHVGSRTVYTTFWEVPDSVSPVTVGLVTRPIPPTPGVPIALSQLAPAGAVSGQVIGFDGVRWKAQNASAGAGVSPINVSNGAISCPTCVVSSDLRLTDARNPTAHAGSHATGQADAVTPAAIGAEPANSQIVKRDDNGNVTIDTVLLGPRTISAGPNQLPGPAAGNAGWITRVSDAASGGDCTVGGGTSAALCLSTGSAWVPLGGGGGPVSDPLVIGTTTIDGTAGITTPSISVGDSGSASRIDITQGTCPATATSGFDYTLCMESGVLYQVSSAGVKTSMVGATGPQGPAGSDMADPGVFILRDEFPNSSHSIGELAWLASGTGATNGTVSPGSSGRDGVRYCATGAAAENACKFTLYSAMDSFYGIGVNSKFTTGWTAIFIAQLDNAAGLGALTNMAAAFSLGNIGGSTLSDTGVGIVADTTDPGLSGCTWNSANWMYMTFGSGRTCVDSGVPAQSGAWYNLKMYTTTLGSVTFSINDSAVQTISTNVPASGTVQVSPSMTFRTHTAAAKRAWVDFFSFRGTGVVR